MKAKLGSKAQKFLDRIDEKEAVRIMKAIEKLEKEPPEGDILKMKARIGYWLRLGGIRVLFEKGEKELLVTNIDHRGQV